MHVGLVLVSPCKDTIKQLQQETPDFTGPDLWIPNSPDLNLVDYTWGEMTLHIYGRNTTAIL